MISSINFLSKAFILLSAGFFILAGCTGSNDPAALRLDESHDVGAAKSRIAVLPIHNMSGAPAPVKAIRQSLKNKLRNQGFSIIEEETLDKFMARHRMRYTGGIDKIIAESLRDETGADAALITSLELYDETYPPKIAVISRLVSTGDTPIIL